MYEELKDRERIVKNQLKVQPPALICFFFFMWDLSKNGPFAQNIFVLS